MPKGAGVFKSFYNYSYNIYIYIMAAVVLIIALGAGILSRTHHHLGNIPTGTNDLDQKVEAIRLLEKKVEGISENDPKYQYIQDSCKQGQGHQLVYEVLTQDEKSHGVILEEGTVKWTCTPNMQPPKNAGGNTRRKKSRKSKKTKKKKQTKKKKTMKKKR